HGGRRHAAAPRNAFVEDIEKGAQPPCLICRVAGPPQQDEGAVSKRREDDEADRPGAGDQRARGGFAAVGREAASSALIAGAGAVGFIILAALGYGALVLLRRTSHAANEARRLRALLDVLHEGVAGCSRMPAAAV